MSDEQMAPVLRSWMHDTDRTAPDARHSADQVRARVEQTRQLGRWWWLPSFGRTRASTPTTDQTTQFQPPPIRATNGQTPTASVSTRSTFSPPKAIAAGAMIFAIGGVFLVAQPFNQQGASVPGAATDEGRPAIEKVTGQFVAVVPIPAPDGRDGQYGPSPDGNYFYYRNESHAGAVEMSDERLSGEALIIQNNDRAVSDVDSPTVNWGTVSIENDAGAWSGTRTRLGLGVEQPTVEFIELVGSGAYEGWSAILYTPGVLHGDVDDRSFVYGAVFLGNLPPDRESYLPE